MNYLSRHKWGLTVSLDTNFDPSGKWNGGLNHLLRKVDIFLPNAIECLRVAGSTDLDKALDYLHDRTRCVLLKLGDKGALVRTETESIHADALKVEVCDRIPCVA